MRSHSVLTFALLVLACAAPVAAQRPFSVDLRGGASIPTGELGATDLDAGAGFSFSVDARVMPHASVYAGWAWNRFGAAGDSHIEDTGYAAGLQFAHPVVASVQGWARAGVLYNHIETESEGGETLADSGHELGWEAGSGVIIPIGERFALTPGVRYRTFSAELDQGQGAANVDLSYVAFDIGLSYSFGPRPVRTAVR